MVFHAQVYGAVAAVQTSVQEPAPAGLRWTTTRVVPAVEWATARRVTVPPR
jgi:hypothetical protein